MNSGSDSWNRSLISLLDQVFRFAYSHGGKQALRILGLERSAKKVYSQLLLLIVDDIQTIEVNNVSASFRMSSPFEFNLFYNKGYNDEVPVLQENLRRLEPDDVFYDIGAHVGIYTILVANALDSGRSIAFEPNPENERRLQENAKLNHGHVESYEYALSDVEDTAKLSIQGDAAEARGSLNNPQDTCGKTISVETIPGDKLINRNEVPPPNIVKIDVEGAEENVIDGLRSTLEQESCRLVYCECHPDALADRGSSISDIVDLLDSIGFNVDIIHNRDNQPFFRAEKKDI